MDTPQQRTPTERPTAHPTAHPTKGFGATRTTRFLNAVIGRLLRLGARLGPMALLTVAGRTTGKPRSTPVALIAEGDGWRLTASYGVVDWVRNLRAAGEATIIFRGRRVRVTATELSLREAAPTLRQTLAEAGPTTLRIIGPYYTTPTDAPLQAWEQEAARHPVFHLQPVQQPSDRRPSDP